jgi:hypothetical protein
MRDVFAEAWATRNYGYENKNDAAVEVEMLYPRLARPRPGTSCM